MAPMNTGRLFAESIQGYGVTHVFMVPAIFNSAMAAIEDTSITRVTAHHEAAAAYMADGYARASHRVGICMGQAVGAGNLAAGLRDAYQACSPVLAISGGPHPDSRYRYLYQIVEDFPMFGPVTKFNARVDKPERLPDMLRQAFRVATTGTPGPVHLEFPGRLGEGIQADGDFDVLVEPKFGSYPSHRPAPDPADVEEAVRVLALAERPVIVAGGGVSASGAQAELVALADKLSIPVATSPNGKDTIPDNHPLAVGLTGTYGRPSANRLLEEADLVFFVGCRAGGLVTANWKFPKPGTRTIQLDIDPTEIGRVYPTSLGLAGDAKLTLTLLTQLVRPASRPRWLRRAQSLLAEWRGEIAAHAASNASPIRPERICKEITDFLPPGALMVADTGHAAIWTGRYVGLTRPGQRYIRCAGTLGWAFPASLGAKCALPDTPVLCFTGDGGLCYHLAELETAARAGINTVVFVNNNSALQQVRRGIDSAYGGTQHGRAGEMWLFRQGVNYARIAEEMGCLGIRVETPDQIRPALERAFSAGRPAVIDAVSDIEAIPPIW